MLLCLCGIFGAQINSFVCRFCTCVLGFVYVCVRVCVHVCLSYVYICMCGSTQLAYRSEAVGGGGGLPKFGFKPATSLPSMQCLNLSSGWDFCCCKGQLLDFSDRAKSSTSVCKIPSGPDWRSDRVLGMSMGRNFFHKSVSRMTIEKIQRHKWFKRMLFIRTKQSMQIFRIIPIIKLQIET